MKLTLALCTAKRPGLLFEALNSLARAKDPAVPWELLLVNNGACERTSAVAAAYTSRLPLREITELTPGLSFARNAAVDAATGDYILWTDDDVRVSSGWLVSYARAIERNPNVAVLGGPIRPIFEGEPPGWLVTSLPLIGSAFAVREPECDTYFDKTNFELPFGANFVVRVEEQRRFRYDVRLGRRPGKLMIGGEETQVMRDILETGARGLWVTEALIEHWIPRSRQTVRYLRRYYAGQGWVQFLEDPAVREAPPTFRKALTAWWRYHRTHREQAPSVWLPAMKEAAETWGQWQASRQAHRGKD